jgi:hypothetical protein
MARGLTWTENDYQAYMARQRRAGGDAGALVPTEDVQGVLASGRSVRHPGGTERHFLDRLRRLVQQHGFLCYHTYDSRRSEEGFPDLLLAKPGWPLVAAELKTNTGKLTLAQQQWLAVLARTEKPQAYVWRPRDWAALLAVLGINEG